MQTYADECPPQASRNDLGRNISSGPVLPEGVTVATRRADARRLRGRKGLNRTLIAAVALLAVAAISGSAYEHATNAIPDSLHAMYAGPENADPGRHPANLLDVPTNRQQVPSPTLVPTGTVEAVDNSSGASSPAAEVQSALVGQTEVSWEGDWKYDVANSSDEQVALTWVDINTGQLAIVIYGERTDASFDSAETALEDLVAAFFEDADATDVVAAGNGALENGSVWKAYTFNFMGIPLTLLMTVSETTDGRYVISTLAGNTEGFQDSIELAQQEIRLDGEPEFLDGLDADLVSSASEG